jgi:hypothetical protein
MPATDYKLAKVGVIPKYPWEKWIAKAAKRPVVLVYKQDFHVSTAQFCDHGRRFIKKNGLTACSFQRAVSSQKKPCPAGEKYNVVVITQKIRKA